MGRKQDKKKQVVQVSSQEHEEPQEDVQDSNEYGLEDQFDGQEVQDESVLLRKIQEKILECSENQKLSWGAIYTIKTKQSAIHQEMQKQIDLVKEKYEKLKQPLLSQISDAVAGKNLGQSIYGGNDLTKNINLKQVKPIAIKDYWSKVFTSIGLVGNQDDIDLLDHVVLFKAQMVDAQTNHIKLFFEFEKNQFIEKKLQVEVSGVIADGQFKKKVTFKALKAVEADSLFGLLTSSQSDDQQLQDTCLDLHRAYLTSTYFYFFDASDELNDQENDEESQGEDEQNDDEDQQSQKDVKAVKKVKGSSIQQKPQCKNQ